MARTKSKSRVGEKLRQPTKSSKHYSSTTEMVRDLLDDGFADELEKQLAKRQIVKELFVLRSSMDISQADVAKHLKCTQSKVSKFEACNDGDIRLADLAKYADALGLSVSIMLTPKNWTVKDEVRHHADNVVNLIDALRNSVAEAQGVPVSESKHDRYPVRLELRGTISG